jgi:putative heme-binding domain-containing protein
LNSIEGQIAALQSPAVNVRHSGFVRLKAQGAAAVPAVAALLSHPNRFVAARAIWLLAQMGGEGIARVRPLLDSREENTRLVAYRALRRAGEDIVELAARMAGDTCAAVRREVALSLRGVEASRSVPLLVKLAEGYDGKDRAYLEALGLGSTGIESEVYAAAATKMGGAAQNWSEAFAGLAWRLHPDAAIPGLQERVLSTGLGAEHRNRALTALAFNASASAAHAVLAVASNRESSLNALAAWWLLNRKSNLWAEHKLDDALKKSGVYDPENLQLQAVEMPPSPKLPPLPEAAEIAKLTGDPQRGQSAVAACYACHRIGDQGIEFGPDLTSFARQQPREVLIQAIAHPSADISHGYEGFEVVTQDGIKITGMLLSSGDPHILKCMGGTVQTIPKKRVASLKPLERSLMYDPSVLGLSAQSVADIVAYLRQNR